MKKVLFIIAMIAVCFNAKMEAGDVKIHSILFCNTTDKNIGKSCQADYDRFIEEMGIIEAALGCEEEWQAYIGTECNKPNLESALSSLNCGLNDVIFFYYSGHGVHAKADSEDGWLPQMCLNYEWYDQEKFVPVTYVRDRLASKGARLVLILTDCCNDEKEWVSVKSLVAQQKSFPSIDAIDVARLKKLFYESRGTVVATSSKRGQTSIGTNNGGGVFSCAFWDELFKVEQGKADADWESVMAATKKGTLLSTDSEQESAYKVDVTGVNSSTNIAPATSPIVVSVEEGELGAAFKQIVNTSYTANERWNMVSGIVQRLFDPDAVVVMVGRDLATNVGSPVNISKYLHELALSKRVKGINIVRTKKNGEGKFSQIVVSEIR